MTTYNTIKVSSENFVATISLARPEKFNAITAEFFSELPHAISELEGTGETRVIVLAAEGKHFCSGLDLSFFGHEMLMTATPLDREHFRRLVLQYQQAFSSLEKARIPAIAAIHGACVGAGLDLVSACDMRFATTSAFFCIQEINLGIMADLGTLQRLPKIMPEGIVRELAYTGDRLSGERASACGFMNSTFNTNEEMMSYVMELAYRIAQQSPLAVAGTKNAINYARDHSVDDALLYAANWQSAIFDRDQILQAISGMKAKESIKFPNLHGAKVGQ